MAFSNDSKVCEICGKGNEIGGGVFRSEEPPYNETLGCPTPSCKGNQKSVTLSEFENKN